VSSSSRATTTRYVHLGYTPRGNGLQPSTTYQSIDKCHTQLIPSRSIITGQPSSVHRGVRLGENISTKWATPQGSLGTNPVQLDSPSISVILNSVHQGVSSQVNPTQSIKEYDLEKYPNRLSCTSRVIGHHPSITSHVNPALSIEEYDLEKVSRTCNHQHSLLMRGAFSTIPSLSWKYSNFNLERGLVRTSAICSFVGRYCINTAFLCTISLM
jgi:hypothetical protein